MAKRPVTTADVLDGRLRPCESSLCSVPLTAFLPTDRALRRLAHDLTGKSYGSEAKVFEALAGALGVDTIENVLLSTGLVGFASRTADTAFSTMS